MLLKGFDVSSHQGEIDWNRAAVGHDFVWMKASEGSTFTDPLFIRNWSRSFSTELKRGAYHFLTTTSTPEKQAEQFLRVYPGAGELAPALDIEWGLHGEIPPLHAAMKWMEIVMRELGVAPVLYLSPGFVADEAKRFGPTPPELAEIGLWIAQWDVETPTVPLPWTSWLAWQTTDKGHVHGIAGPVDLNVMLYEQPACVQPPAP